MKCINRNIISKKFIDLGLVRQHFEAKRAEQEKLEREEKEYEDEKKRKEEEKEKRKEHKAKRKNVNMYKEGKKEEAKGI